MVEKRTLDDLRYVGTATQHGFTGSNSGYGSDGSLPRLLFEQSGKCFYCHCLPTYESKSDGWSQKQQRFRRPTREHLHRKIDGGRFDRYNIVLACAYCNSSRGEASVEDHQAAMKELVRRGVHPCHEKGWRREWLTKGRP